MYDDFDDFEQPKRVSLEDLSFSEHVELILSALWGRQYKEWDCGENDRRLYGEEDQEFDESTLVPQKHWITAKMNEKRIVTIKWREDVMGRALECSAYISRYEHGYNYTVKGSGGAGSSLCGSTIITKNVPGYEPPSRQSGDEYAFIDWGNADPFI